MNRGCDNFQELNVLLSSCGRRVGLMDCFRSALRDLGICGSVVAVDCSLTAPAFHLADAAWQVPRCSEPEFAQVIVELCQRESVRLAVPTIDPELPVYAGNRDLFAAVRTAVAVSGPDTVAIAADKVRTHQWLSEHGFATVRQAPANEALAQPSDWRFPLIAKPRRGSAGIGVAPVADLDALRVACRGRDDLVVEEIAPGQEYTINLFVNASGKCICVVPHMRLEVRAGEVSKAVTAKRPALIELGRQIGEALPGAYGPLNVQCFVDAQGTIRVTEINPRFGGGYPIAQAAGANFPRWLIEEALGRSVWGPFDDWEDGLAMLRYDSAVFVPGRVAGLGA